MAILWVFPAFIFLSHCLDLLIYVAPLTQGLQKACVSSAPFGRFWELSTSIVCGSDITNAEFLSLFQKSGLYHLLVVSGSHLIFMSLILQIFLARNLKLLSLLLLGYSLFTGFEPPIAKALTNILLGFLSDRFKWGWSRLGTTSVSGILLWGLFPTWILSYSFLLSWTASLALAICQDKDKITAQILVYTMLFPILSFSPPAPETIVFNILLAPLVGLLLFPLCLLSFVVPWAATVSNLLWEALVDLLRLTTQSLSPLPPQPALPMIWIWAGLWSLSLWAHLFQVRKNRNV